jgi:hypothetical protein
MRLVYRLTQWLESLDSDRARTGFIGVGRDCPLQAFAAIPGRGGERPRGVAVAGESDELVSVLEFDVAVPGRHVGRDPGGPARAVAAGFEELAKAEPDPPGRLGAVLAVAVAPDAHVADRDALVADRGRRVQQPLDIGVVRWQAVRHQWFNFGETGTVLDNRVG